MTAIIKRELKNYLKNPIFWAGLFLVIWGVYQAVSPYFKIRYFRADEEIKSVSIEEMPDADIMEGFLPTSPTQQKTSGMEKIIQALREDMEISDAQVNEIQEKMENMDMSEIPGLLETYGYYGAEYTFSESEYYQGSADEVNSYIQKKLEEHSFSYYFARKFADFSGLFMAFFSLVLFAFLFYQDTKKSTYELLHTKPVRAWQYILGKISGGFLAGLFVLGILILVFFILCFFHAEDGFRIRVADFLYAACIYMLPNLLMMLCVYAVVALLFKSPLPAVPLLFLYIVYSNMGSRNSEGIYGYYGRPLAIMVRFPGRFFDTTPPPMALANQLFLILASTVLCAAAVCIWERRNVY